MADLVSSCPSSTEHLFTILGIVFEVGIKDAESGNGPVVFNDLVSKGMTVGKRHIAV